MISQDDERQQRSLIRFYRRLGFRTLREIGPGLSSVPDRVVWGGEGTIMEIDIDVMRKVCFACMRPRVISGPEPCLASLQPHAYGARMRSDFGSLAPPDAPGQLGGRKDRPGARKSEELSV